MTSAGFEDTPQFEIVDKPRGKFKGPTKKAHGFNQMARSSCPECGAPVAWVDAAAAQAHGLDVGQLLAFHGASSPDEVEFWTCTACSEAGAMGAPTSSF